MSRWVLNCPVPSPPCLSFPAQRHSCSRQVVQTISSLGLKHPSRSLPRVILDDFQMAPRRCHLHHVLGEGSGVCLGDEDGPSFPAQRGRAAVSPWNIFPLCLLDSMYYSNTTIPNMCLCSAVPRWPCSSAAEKPWGVTQGTVGSLHISTSPETFMTQRSI